MGLDPMGDATGDDQDVARLDRDGAFIEMKGDDAIHGAADFFFIMGMSRANKPGWNRLQIVTLKAELLHLPRDTVRVWGALMRPFVNGHAVGQSLRWGHVERSSCF